MLGSQGCASPSLPIPTRPAAQFYTPSFQLETITEPNRHQAECPDSLRSPEELVDALLTEGALEQRELHLACVDGSHSWVPKPANAQCALQLCLGARLCPQPPVKGKGVNTKMPQSGVQGACCATPEHTTLF